MQHLQTLLTDVILSQGHYESLIKYTDKDLLVCVTIKSYTTKGLEGDINQNF